MKAVIEIEMDNDAFMHPNTSLELSRVLARMGDDIERMQVNDVGHYTTVTDLNGNTVGRLDIVEDEHVDTYNEENLT
tara:strand:- start:218 stop:448 length:231 start_codon:yes stop_codon:yes gene_type:complete